MQALLAAKVKQILHTAFIPEPSIVPFLQADAQTLATGSKLERDFGKTGEAPFGTGRPGEGKRFGGNAEKIPIQFPVVVDVVEKGYGIGAKGQARYGKARFACLFYFETLDNGLFFDQIVLLGIINTDPDRPLCFLDIAYFNDQLAVAGPGDGGCPRLYGPGRH